MRGVVNILGEAFVVLVVALVLAIGINTARPNGIDWFRDYFPPSQTMDPDLVSKSPTERLLSGQTNGLDTLPSVDSQSGFRFIEFEAMRQAFEENQGLTLFIDARNETTFHEGHVPGAWLFDHYHFERYVDEVLPMCLAADRIIVYCTGGECEDSQFACQDLSELGVPRERLEIFKGGIREWKANQMQIELGPRDSGMMETP